MEFLANQIKATKGTEKNLRECGLIFLFDEKDLLRGLQSLVARGVSDLSQNESGDFDVFEVEFEKH